MFVKKVGGMVLSGSIFFFMFIGGWGNDTVLDTAANKTAVQAAGNMLSVNTAMASPIPGEVPVTLTTDEQGKLNLFFSAFSEAGIKPFVEAKISNDELIKFGVKHCMIHRRERIIDGKLSSDEVNRACYQYFGVMPDRHRSVGDYFYVDGFYTIPLASGDVVLFSQITQLTDLGNGVYSANVNVYSAPSGFSGHVLGTPESWKAAREEVYLIAQMNATIMKVTTKPMTRYILREYQTLVVN